MSDVPIILTSAGRTNTPSTTLRANLVAAVTASNPGYTASLPGSLIEDIVSTDTQALVVCDQAVTELINSLTPYGANAFVLNQLAQIYGVAPNLTTNTSVYVVFTGSPGYVIAQGFIVSDGTYQYVIQTGGIVGTGGTSLPLYAVASVAGTWSVPVGTVTQIVTSVPTTVTLTVTNPNTGTPSGGTETEGQYRSRVLQAGLVGAKGMSTYVKTLLTNITGVQLRLVSVQQQTTGGWKIIVGGGDPYQVANAIFTGLFDISTLVGSATSARNVTVTISDYPDTYSIIFVVPVQQNVSISLTWNTSSTNVVSSAAAAQLGQTALAAYVNGIAVGQPMNLFELQATFQTAMSTILDPNLLTRMVFSVIINGSVVAPISGTGVIAGDPEGYFTTTASAITISQG